METRLWDRRKIRLSISFFRMGAAVAAAVLLLVLLSGCGMAHSDPTAILSDALDAEMCIEKGEFSYRVTVHLGAEKNGESSSDGTTAERDCEIIFLSPASVAGLTARSCDGKRSLSLGELSSILTEDAASRLFLAERLLSPGTVIGREMGTENGKSCLLLRCSDGRVFSVVPESGKILSVRHGDVTARIDWIEPRRGEIE